MSNFRAMFGDLVIDGPAWEARLNDTILGLTPTEFEVLMVLASRPRRVVAADEVVRRVWGDGWFGDDNNLAVHVSKLRRKLGESARSPRYIHTVRGVGYRFDPGADAAGHASAREADYQALLDHQEAVELRTDALLRVISIHPAGAPVLGYDPPDLLGRYLSEVADHPWGDHASALEGVQVLIASGIREWAARHVACRADGTRAHVDVATRLQVDDEGRLLDARFAIVERDRVAGGGGLAGCA
jgi:DNA-binding winged helix-turn-helix (wHTH) protein